MSARLSRQEATDYWRGVHISSQDSLGAVCFPNSSRFLNVFFDLNQRRAIGRALSVSGLDLADSSLLEIGCGRGRWLSRFRQRGARAYGVDISEDAVAHCVRRGLDARLASAGELPFPDDSFDLLASVTVMIHLDPDLQEQAAVEMLRVCRPGGYILLLEGTRPDPSPHVWTRSYLEWISLFDGANPVLVETHYYAPIIRSLWRSSLMGLRPKLVYALEHLAIAYSLPLEMLLMQLLRGHHDAHGLQHLILLRKPG